MTGLHKFALIGFGEAGSILGEELAAAGRDVVMYDILLDAPASREAMLEKARRAHVRAAGRLPPREGIVPGSSRRA